MLVLGIDVPTEILSERIHKRIIDRINQGMIEEINTLHESGVSWERMASFGLEYRSIASYLQGHVVKEAMIEELAAKTRQFAKRQRLWLKHDQTIIWLPFPVDTAEASRKVADFLKSTPT
jgi:tRNA dimethylallyltransferase